MTADTAALLITLLILIAVMLWVPLLEWCAGCLRVRKIAERSTHFEERVSYNLATEGGKASAGERRW